MCVLFLWKNIGKIDFDKIERQYYAKRLQDILLKCRNHHTKIAKDMR